MKVAGFTFIRNAIIYDYPIVEAIKSILPICDEVVVAVGKSDDDTRSLVESIAPDKIKIIDTIWDDTLREGGKVLALETDKAFQHISPDTDWAFYIQGDEVLHEKYLETVRKAMQQHLDNPKIDGLLFHYLHFYGSYDYIATSLNWYDKEIRVVRNHKSIYSYKDAQGFRKNNNQKLSVKLIDAYIYHYGWVKDPRKMQKKQENFNKFWHDDKWVEQNVAKAEEFDYLKSIRSLQVFGETHPQVMQSLIEKKNWQFNYDISFNKTSLKDILKLFAKNYLVVP